ncbi:MAG: COG1470 family protein [Gemmatimonadota bacterium]
MRCSPRCFAPLGLSLLIASCGDHSPTGHGFTIGLSTNLASHSIDQGSYERVFLKLVRAGGFSGDVSVAVSGLPSGVTGSITPATFTPGTDSVEVRVTVGLTVPTGTYTATATATGRGVASASTTWQVTVLPRPDFALTVDPGALMLQAGTSSSATINILRTNLVGPVDLMLVSPPPGVSGTFTPSSPGAESSALTIAVDASVPAGSHNLTIRGSATGPGERTATLPLSISAAANYALSAAPALLTVVRGQASDVVISISRSNFTGTVNLTLASPPAGVGGVFNPASTIASNSTLTISVDQSAAAGLYTLSVLGASAGVPTLIGSGPGQASAAAPGDRSVSIQLQVSDPPPTGHAAEYAFCGGHSPHPLWFGFREGDRPWTEIAPMEANGARTYSFRANAENVEVAWVQSNDPMLSDAELARTMHSHFDALVRRLPDVGRPSPGRVPLPVIASRSVLVDQQMMLTTHHQLSVSELPGRGERCSAAAPVDQMVFGVQNLTNADDRVWVSSTNTESVVFNLPSTSTSVGVNPGVHDVLFVLGRNLQVFGAQSIRNVSVPTPGSGLSGRTAAVPVTVDRNTVPAVVAGSISLTNKPAAMTAELWHWFGTSRGILGPFINEFSGTADTRPTFRPAAVAAGDYYGYSITGRHHTLTVLDERFLTDFPSQFLGSRSYALPPAVPPFSVTHKVGAYSATGPVPSAYAGASRSALFAAGLNTYLLFQSPGWVKRTNGDVSHTLTTSTFTGARFPTNALLVGPVRVARVQMGSEIGPRTAGSTQIMAGRMQFTP